MQVDESGWSRDGDFTIRLVEALQGIEQIAFLRIEDAPASRAGSGYNLLANEVYVRFTTVPRTTSERWLGVLSRRRIVHEASMTLQGLDTRLAAVEGIGAADYADEGMLQYLKTERIVPPYQTRGYKLVELVRVYAMGPGPSGGHPPPGDLPDELLH
jgi:hypothetical protein